MAEQPQQRQVTQLQTRAGMAPVLMGGSWFASFLTHNAANGHVDTDPPGDLVSENGERRVRAGSALSENETVPDANDGTNTPSLPKDLPPKHLTRRLIDVFFARFHVHFPILRKSIFISSVEDESVSATLLRSVLFVGSTQCDPETYHLLGFSSRNDAGDHLFGLAKASFDSDSTSDRTNMIQSCFLLHYWWGQPTAFKDSLWWFMVAIRSAQCLGMHKTTRNSTLPADVQKLWRRIWWCLYVSGVFHVLVSPLMTYWGTTRFGTDNSHLR